MKESAEKNFKKKKADKEVSDIEVKNLHYSVKESDKGEGIKMYGDKPLENKDFEFDNLETRRKKIQKKIKELEKAYKSSEYVGNKEQIENEILSLENVLKQKLKTSTELAMEGNIAWSKKEEKPSKEKEYDLSEKEEALPEQMKEEEEKEDAKEEKTEETKQKEETKQNAEKISEKSKDDKTKEIKKETNNKENEEKRRQDLLNAAEIFCKYNASAYERMSPKERKEAEENALKELKEKHNDREINAAINVANKRNEMASIKSRLYKIEKEYKQARENPKSDMPTVMAKYNQQIQNIKRELRLIDNDYLPLLKELKIANLDHQLSNLEKYKDHADFKEKVQDAELFALSIIQSEIMRYQDAKISANSLINPKGWDHIKNFFKRFATKASKNRLVGGYLGMSRGKRMAVNAALIGGTTALWLPATVAAGPTAVGFVAYKMARSIAGGTLGAFLSKKIFQPIARKAYEHDTAKTLSEQQEEITGTDGKKKHWWNFKKEPKEEAGFMGDLREAASGNKTKEEKEEILKKIAEININLSEKYAEKYRRNNKFFVANNALGTVAAGLIGGKGGQMFSDWLVGPEGLGIFDNGTGKTTGSGKETIPGEGKGGFVPGTETGPNSGSGIPNKDILDAATVGKGEGIEHALHRQLEMNPEKFGYTGDLNNHNAIHQWAGRQADIIAHDQNYFQNGIETRVRDLGPQGPQGNPAYILDIDSSGNPKITEYYEGKPYGNTGPNNVYEYGHKHTSGNVNRYYSALENTPDQTDITSNSSVETGGNDVLLSEYRNTSTNQETGGDFNSNTNQEIGNEFNPNDVALETGIDSKFITIPVNENFKAIISDVKVYFSHDNIGNVVEMKSNFKMNGFRDELLLENGYKENIIEWSQKHNVGESFELNQVSNNTIKLYQNLAIYEGIKDNLSLENEAVYLKNAIIKNLNELSRYGDIVDPEKLPLEFR